MQHKNLTPFYWGPVVTSRVPPQMEMAICVRGVFRLVPGAPLTPIEDWIEQGFMSGDRFDDADIERTGALRYASDFAHFKPHAEVYLKGHAHAPGGRATSCPVRVQVGDWSKTLMVTGARTWRPGVLFGASASDPAPFAKIPLGWESAYGGEGYARNPVGKGLGEELPHLEDPKSPLKSRRDRPEPVSFAPISGNWPQRVGKRGKKYGKKWRKKRAPWFSEDFDWTYFNAAPADQQLQGYLRGDEPVVFQNMHPSAPTWETHLPGLRIRALTRDVDGVTRDVTMQLDTLYADLDEGRLYLTWRGHVPVNQLDLTDVAGVLIASEKLTEEPKPREHYEAILLEYLADPIGLDLPPGFMMVAEAVEAAELAELKGEPMPDMKAVAENLPAGCPFPPWMLLAVGGDPDPLGVKAMIPKELIAAAEGDLTGLGLPSQGDIDAGMANLAALKPDGPPVDMVQQLKQLEPMLPEDKRENFRKQMEDMQKALEDMDQKLAEVPEEAKPPTPEPPPPAPPPAEQIEQQKAGLLKQLEDIPPEARPEGLAGVIGKVQASPGLESVAAAALASFATIPLPEPPELPDADAIISEHREKITAWEADLKDQGVEHPLMGLFGLGHRLLERAPKWAAVPGPDMSPLVNGLDMVAAKLTAAGVSAAALAPLLTFKGKLTDLLAKLPPPKPKPPQLDFAAQNLRGKDFSGQDLSGKCFVEAKLMGAVFSGANLRGADFTEAALSRADFTGADLTGAIFTSAVLSQANFDKARLNEAQLKEVTCNEASFLEADLSGANLELAQVVECDFSGARMVGAAAVDGNFEKSILRGVDLTNGNLESAKFIGAKLERAKLIGANLRFAVLTKAWLDEADLSDADLCIAQLTKMRALGGRWHRVKLDMTNCGSSLLSGLDLTGATGDMTGFTKSDLSGAIFNKVVFSKADFSSADLEGADLSHATLKQASFRDTKANRARFVEADMQGCSASGVPEFEGAVFVGLKGRGTVWMDAKLDGADFSYADLRDSHWQGSHGKAPRFFAAKLKDAVFRKARYTGAEFVQTDLCNVDLTHTELLDGVFVSANLYEAKFLWSQFAGCDFTRANLERAQFDEGKQP